jgi:hypothetical protein
MDYFGLGKAKYKVIFSSSTKSSAMSATGQLGYYKTKKEAMKAIRERLPMTAGLFDTMGHATLYERKKAGKPAKWKKLSSYTLTKSGYLTAGKR